MTKDQYIRLISNASSKQGDKLIELMDYFNAGSLRELTLEQVEKWYKENMV
jgi:hypothetical protein